MLRLRSQNILQASLILLGAALFSRMMGFIREMVIAHRFGTGADYDVFLVAVSIPVALSNTLLYALPSGLIPCYLSEKKRIGRDVPSAFLNQAVLFFGVLLCIISLFILVLAPLILKHYAPAFREDEMRQGVFFLRMTSCVVFFGGMYALMRSFMHAENHFLVPALAPLLLNGAVIFFVLRLSAHAGIRALGWGMVAGYGLQAVVISSFTVRHALRRSGTRTRSPVLQAAIQSVLFVLFIEVTGQMNVIIDRAFLGSVTAGSMAALNFAGTLCQVPVGILGITLGTAIFPSISAMAVTRDYVQLGRVVNTGLKTVLFVALPVTLFMIIYADPVVALVFQRGAFGAESRDLTAGAVGCLSFSVPFLAAHAVLIKTFYAMKIRHVLVMVTLAGLAAKILFSHWLVIPFQHRGLALATASAAALLAICMLAFLQKKIRLFNIRVWAGFLLRVLLTAMLAVLGTRIGMYPYLSRTMHIALPGTFLAAGIIYILLHVWMKTDVLLLLIHRMKKR